MSWACPWAHRTLVMRVRKGAEGVISFSSVAPLMLENGWGTDPLQRALPARDLHRRAAGFRARHGPGALGSRSAEDHREQRIVEILRIMNGAFDAFADVRHDFYTRRCVADRRAERGGLRQRKQQRLSLRIRTTQAAYEDAFAGLFTTLDRLEERLDGQQWLVGGQETEADWRLFTTLVRFDPVYHYHFKCNLRRLRDYPRLWAFTKRLYALPGIAETVDIPYIKRHYFGSHKSINPHGIVPVGPDIDFGGG
ncbi:MAG: glutathione S-transferase C-terminal domain-containing protein [Myxococcota bacterium]